MQPIIKNCESANGSLVPNRIWLLTMIMSQILGQNFLGKYIRLHKSNLQKHPHVICAPPWAHQRLQNTAQIQYCPPRWAIVLSWLLVRVILFFVRSFYLYILLQLLSCMPFIISACNILCAVLNYVVPTCLVHLWRYQRRTYLLSRTLTSFHRFNEDRPVLCRNPWDPCRKSLFS